MSSHHRRSSARSKGVLTSTPAACYGSTNTSQTSWNLTSYVSSSLRSSFQKLGVYGDYDEPIPRDNLNYEVDPHYTNGPPQLPPELWHKIATEIEPREIRTANMMGVNSVFLDRALDEEYRTLVLDSGSNIVSNGRMQRKMERCHDPFIGRRVREVVICPSSEAIRYTLLNNVLSWDSSRDSQPPAFLRYVLKEESNAKSINKALSSVDPSRVEVLRIVAVPQETVTAQGCSYLQYAWRTFSTNISELNLSTTGSGRCILSLLPRFSSGEFSSVWFPNLQTVKIVAQNYSRAAHGKGKSDLDPRAAAENLAVMLSRSPALKTLVLQGLDPDSSPIHTSAQSLIPVLRYLETLYVSMEAEDSYSRASWPPSPHQSANLSAFLSRQRTSLRQLHIGDKDIVRGLSLYDIESLHISTSGLLSDWDTFIGQLKSGSCLELEDLKIIPWNQCIETPYLNEDRTKQLIRALGRATALRTLAIQIETISPRIMELLATNLPRLESLTIITTKTCLKNEEGEAFGERGFSASVRMKDPGHPYVRAATRFRNQLQRKGLQRWPLRFLSVKSHAMPRTPNCFVHLLQVFSECLPGVRFLEPEDDLERLSEDFQQHSSRCH